VKFKNGFTVIEVLVVIGIIAILTVIIFPSITNIRAKNKDAERVADISAIQLGLSLYYNQNSGYPGVASLSGLAPKYFPADSLVPPTDDAEHAYVYVPLKKAGSNKCTYYHLGVLLELPSGQIDTANTFSTLKSAETNQPDPSASNYYQYCADYSGPGIDGTNPLMYNVHP
jgi:prepilin-type N-terminal cleavage/methylation domain-containing protein